MFFPPDSYGLAVLFKILKTCTLFERLWENVSWRNYFWEKECVQVCCPPREAALHLRPPGLHRSSSSPVAWVSTSASFRLAGWSKQVNPALIKQERNIQALLTSREIFARGWSFKKRLKHEAVFILFRQKVVGLWRIDRIDVSVVE